MQSFGDCVKGVTRSLEAVHSTMKRMRNIEEKVLCIAQKKTDQAYFILTFNDCSMRIDFVAEICVSAHDVDSGEVF